MNTNDAVLGLSADGSNLIAYTSQANAGTSREGMLVYDRTLNTLNFCDGSSWRTIAISGVVGTAAGTVTGAVQFRNGSGVFAADDTNFIWDDTNNRLGIGTAGPNAQLEVSGLSLGGTLGNSVLMGRFGYANSNASKLDVIGYRTANGTTWNSGSTRLQQVIDGTYMGYIQFNGTGNDYGLSFGTGGSTNGYSDATEAMRITAAGNVGIGTTNPSSPLYVYRLNESIAGTNYGVFMDHVLDPTSDSAMSARGIFSRARTTLTVPDNFSSATALVGLQAVADHAGTGTVSGMYGAYINADLSGAVSGTVGNQYGSYNYASVTSSAGADITSQIGTYAHTSVGAATTGTITNSRAFFGLITPGTGGAVITTGTGLEVGINGTSPNMTNWRGIYIQDDGRSGAGDYAIFSDAGGTQSRIDGPLGLGGNPNAAAKLDVASTTQGFLPPRMTTAQVTAIATPTDGLMAYDTTTDTIKLYANGAWVSLLSSTYTESDPQVGSLGTAGNACISTGITVDCSDSNIGTKDDVTTRTASGFWQTSTATTAEGWPETATWYHLLNSTHSNAANYYSMQFAGDFYDSKDLYYRATNGSGTAAWNKVWHSGNDGAGSTLDADLLDGQSSSSFLPAGTVTGAVQFRGSTGTLAADDTNLVWDDTNNRLGVGVAAPAAALDVRGVGAGTTPATTGTTDPTMNFRAARGTVGVDIGMLDVGTGYLQTRNTAALGTTYSFALQPTGGNVGIGTTAPSNKFEVQGTATDTSGTKNLVWNYLTINPSVASTGNFFSVYNLAQSAGASDIASINGSYSYANHAGTGTVSSVIGSRGYAYNTSTGTVATLYGAYNVARNNATGTATTIYGSYSQAGNTTTGSVTSLRGEFGSANNIGTSTIASAIGVQSYVGNNSTGVITDAYGFYTDLGNASGTVGAYYGLYVNDDSATATNAYGVYTAGAIKSYFGGNVGLGTAAPLSKLAVGGAGGATWQTYIQGQGTTNTTYGLVVRNSTGSTNTFYVRDDGYVYVGAGGLSVAGTSTLAGAVTASTKLTSPLIGAGGITAPSQSIETDGNISLSNGGTIYGSDSATGNNLSLQAALNTADGARFIAYGKTSSGSGQARVYGASNVTGTAQAIGFYNYAPASTQLGYFRSNGDLVVIGSGTTCTIGNNTNATMCSSDARLKDRLSPVTGALDSLVKLNPVYFHWKNPKKSEAQNIGLIAQDVQKVYPQLVSVDDNGYLQLAYAGLVTPLIGAVKELDAKMKTQEASIARLTAANDDLKGEYAALRALVEKQGRELARLSADP